MEGMPDLPINLLVAGMLIFSRLTGMLVSMPGFTGVPMMARLALALPLTVVLLPSAANAHTPATLPILIGGVLFETLVGIGLGMVLSIVVGTLAITGEMIAGNIGLHMAMMLDPLTKLKGDFLSALMTALALGLFFGTNTHHECIVLLAKTLQRLPPGTAGMESFSVLVLMDVVGLTLRLGVALAGPVIIFVFLVHVALGILGRMSPSLNVFFSIGMSLSMIIGLTVLMLGLPTTLYAYMPLLPTAVQRAGEFLGIGP